ncbi:MAG: hypothetical protein OXFUSZZB_002413, partial [Candidatus Fervidibacter sp.]
MRKVFVSVVNEQGRRCHQRQRRPNIADPPKARDKQPSDESVIVGSIKLVGINNDFALSA